MIKSIGLKRVEELCLRVDSEFLENLAVYYLIDCSDKDLFIISQTHNIKKIIEVLNPRPRDIYQENMFNYILDNNKWCEEYLPMYVQVFERFKRGEIDFNTFRRYSNYG